MIVAPATNRLFGRMIAGSFVPSERGWKALLDVGPNCSEGELMAAAHRYADRMALRHGQVVLTYEAGRTAGIARLWINLVDVPRRVWTPASETVEFELPRPRLSDGSCLLEQPGNSWATAADCGCEECQWITADPVGWRRDEHRHEAITQEIPVTSKTARTPSLSGEMDTSGQPSIVNHTPEDIQVLGAEDRGPRTPPRTPTEDPSPTTSETPYTGGSENSESGGVVPVLYLVQGGGIASIAPGPWHRQYARSIVILLADERSRTARQIGIDVGCVTPRIVHGTLTELLATGWVQMGGKTQHGHATWTTDRDPAEMPQREATA